MEYDVIIVGAGAAGLMTAIQAAQGGVRVLVLEGQQKVGAKILMSGGTRCNVTNKVVSEKDYNSQYPLYVRHILRGFDNQRTIKFFNELGVELVLEPTGKYFPSTNSGKTVLDALLRRLQELNVKLLCKHKVLAIGFEDNQFILKGEGFEFKSKQVVLTTGGLSYPTTGSDGTGYRLAQSFGHPLIHTTPSLTPLISNDNDLKALSGVTLDVRLTLFVEGKKRVSFSDSFLFTHLGFSGPSALDISRHFLRAEGKKEIKANFLPRYDESSLLAYLRQLTERHPRKLLRSVLTELMPQRLVDVIFKKAKLEATLTMDKLDKISRQRLIDLCVQHPLHITAAVGYGKAEATAGGVDFSEINPKILESKIIPGLFFAGEILDVDGRIGGFNFQWAWGSGFAVAQELIKRKKGF